MTDAMTDHYDAREIRDPAPGAIRAVLPQPDDAGHAMAASREEGANKEEVGTSP